MRRYSDLRVNYEYPHPSRVCEIPHRYYTPHNTLTKGQTVGLFWLRFFFFDQNRKRREGEMAAPLSVMRRRRSQIWALRWLVRKRGNREIDSKDI